MYCPRCATQNIDNARFCRSCGANLSLVPQALSGRLPDSQSDNVENAIRGAIRRRREPNLGHGIRRASIGLAFLTIVVALFFSRGSAGVPMIWLLIPAFLLLGKGIGEIITVLGTERASQNALPPAALRTSDLSRNPIQDPVTPPSVTENTTRHLEDERQRPRETS